MLHTRLLPFGALSRVTLRNLRSPAGLGALLNGVPQLPTPERPAAPRGARCDPQYNPAESSLGASAADRALHATLLAGDERAFRELIRQYHGKLVRFARTFVSSDAVAEEVAQEAWLAVTAGLDSFEGRSSLRTWIFRIVSNRAKTRALREGRQIPFSSLSASDGEHAVDPARFSGGEWVDAPARWDDNTPEKLVLSQELRAAIRDAIALLPPGQRAVATLRDLEGLDAAEVCCVLDISEANQRVLLHRARAKLRQTLEEHFRGAK